MGEEERCSFNNEIERRGPLAARFNFRRWFWSSKLDLSSPNTSDAFVNAMDVVERTEDGINVDCFSFDESIPFRAGEPCWSTRGAPNLSFNGSEVPLEDVENISGLVTAGVRN